MQFRHPDRLLLFFFVRSTTPITFSIKRLTSGKVDEGSAFDVSMIHPHCLIKFQIGEDLLKKPVSVGHNQSRLDELKV